MDTREQAQSLLQTLGRRLGLPLALDADGACGLRIDDRLDITLRLEMQPPALLAYAPVGALPASGADAVLRRLLAANHVWEGSQGATWSVHDGQVTLARLLPLQGLDADALADALARLADVARAEQERLQNHAAAPDAGRFPIGMVVA